MSRASIAVSMGDPTGIGPEVTVRTLAGRRGAGAANAILVGDVGVYRDTARRLKLGLRFAEWEPGRAMPRGAVPVRVVSELAAADRRPGRPTLGGGRAAFDAILEAVRLIQAGHAAALVTAPICKANLNAAGAHVPGHTELLADLTRSTVRMMMVGPRLRVCLATTHVAIARLPAALTRAGVLETILVTHDALRRHFRIARPRLAVTGLNPHAGEEGLFGDEEKRVIAPAVAEARRRRVRATGPLAADGLFPHAVAGEYDGVVCMYHDQGLGPFKLLHFADGVNFTAGLPFIRTSPDHGTAHAIAGRNVADPRSMAAAMRLAAELSAR